MELDIDSFLNKHEEKENKKNDNNKNEKIDLNFQKYVEDKLENIQNKSQEKNLIFLEKAYSEVKKFDKDLPKKFLGIEEKGGIVLKELGDKYSKDFLLKIKSNIETTKNNILTNISLINRKINEEDFSFANNEIKKINNKIENISKHFFEIKSKLLIEIKKTEILLNKKIEEFKLNKLIKIKSTINMNLKKLNQYLNPENLNLIENQIIFLNHFSNNLPEIFLSELINEKNLINKIIIKSQNYLFIEEEKEFNLKKGIIENLIEQFHKLKIEKKLEEILIVYNEIIIEFQKLPEIFFEKKVKLFREINNLYGSINNLIVNNNLSTFYETYKYGKMLEEIREYFEHVNKTKKTNKENLLKIKEKLDLLPNKYNFEKEDLSKYLNSLLNAYDNKSKHIITKNRIQNNNNNNIEKNSKLNQNIEEKEITLEKELLNENLDKNLKTEINIYFQKLKNTDKKEELKIYYEKIIFYLKLSNINEKTKTNLLHKLNKIVTSKKLLK